MDTSKPYLQAIGANLRALRSTLAEAMQEVDHGLEAIEQGQQNTAVGSILPTEQRLTLAVVLIQATLILHRQK